VRQWREKDGRLGRKRAGGRTRNLEIGSGNGLDVKGRFFFFVVLHLFVLVASRRRRVSVLGCE